MISDAQDRTDVPVLVDISELDKSGGSVFCMTAFSE